MSSSEIDLCGRCNWIPACIFLRNQILNACIRRAAPIESFWCWKIAFQSLFYAHQCIVNNSKSRFHSLGSEEKWHLIYDIWTLTPMRKIRYQLDHQLISPPHMYMEYTRSMSGVSIFKPHSSLFDIGPHQKCVHSRSMKHTKNHYNRKIKSICANAR